MTGVPKDPKIYHITHVDNLAGIIRDGVLWSDGERLARELQCTMVGMSEIKQRRLQELPVTCHVSTTVGEYVPFYFCPRSIMLYILHMGNHPDITYRGGQGPIVHLMADLHRVVEWAHSKERRWAFSVRNAGTRYARFFADKASLDRVKWNAVRATDFRDPIVKEGKQAEFLIHESFPWGLVECVGVRDSSAKTKVDAILADADHKPLVTVKSRWYY